MPTLERLTAMELASLNTTIAGADPENLRTSMPRPLTWTTHPAMPLTIAGQGLESLRTNMPRPLTTHPTMALFSLTIAGQDLESLKTNMARSLTTHLAMPLFPLTIAGQGLESLKTNMAQPCQWVTSPFLMFQAHLTASPFNPSPHLFLH
jgi:hypothetical protein